MSSGPLLSVQALCKRFPVAHGLLGGAKRWLSALDNVSFDLIGGQTLGVVGESGSGKSTLARVLVRLVPATAGRVLFQGQDLLRASRKQSADLHRRIQIVFQDPYSSLDPRLRLEALISEGLYHSGLTWREKQRRAAELLELVGLSPSMFRNYPHQLSGGQRQRIGIARALAAEPQVLIADEPVSALDGSIQGQILNLLHDLQRERGLTMIFITHDLSVARHMCDRIAVMHLGQIVELAETQELFRRPAHPYTQALLSAIPTYGQRRQGRIVLQGDVPSAIDPPATCRFASRCIRRVERCTREEPALQPAVTSCHAVACFNWEVTGDEA